jgi:SAM-dependent methyltransferase
MAGSLIEVLRLLGDPTRLRLLSLVHEQELSVAELQEILGMGQSRISSHLSLLRQANLVEDRRDGKRSFYTAPNRPAKELAGLLDIALRSVAELPEHVHDRQALELVIQRRRAESERYFNTIAGRLGKNYCPGRSWEAIGHLLLRLTPAIDIADLGSGEGMISQLLARRARTVWCIDNAPKMIEAGIALAAENGLDNLHFKLGDIEAVPLADQSVDLALLSQALHHADKPAQAIREAFRILRPGGQLIVLDLNKHSFEQARSLYGDQWLGFAPARIFQWLRDAGFHAVSADVVTREPAAPHFETVLAAGTRPAA